MIEHKDLVHAQDVYHVAGTRLPQKYQVHVVKKSIYLVLFQGSCSSIVYHPAPKDLFLTYEQGLDAVIGKLQQDIECVQEIRSGYPHSVTVGTGVQLQKEKENVTK